MAIKYTIVQGKNLRTKETIYYPSVKLNGTKTLDEICSDIESRTTIDTSEVKGILCELERVIYRNLSDGNSVRLGDLGSFHLSVTASGRGVEAIDDVRAEQVSATHVQFTPSAKLSQVFSSKALASGGTEYASVRFERSQEVEKPEAD